MQVLGKNGTEASFSLDGLEHDPRWALIQRLLASKHFCRSTRLNSFLLYVCRCALEGRGEEITEQQIGIHVFHRSPNYNPGDDNIVRTTARQLRQRLALYYQEDGKSENVRLEIPRGGYHPIFTSVTEEHPEYDPVRVDSACTMDEPRTARTTNYPIVLPWYKSVLWLSLAIAVGVCLTLICQRIIRTAALHRSRLDPLWSALFVPGKTTVFVSGDAGLNMYDNLAKTQVELGNYISGDYLATPEAQPPNGYSWASLASRRYVSFVDLQLADRMRQIVASRGAQFSIKFARDVHPQDLRGANIVFVGAPTYNPWVEMFDNQLNFRLHYDGAHNSMVVLNRKPQAGEPAEYDASAAAPDDRGYTNGFGYIAFTKTLEGDGRVLMIEGSTVAGVDAAASFLLDDAKMAPVMQKISQNSGGVSDFEILLAAEFLKSSSPEAHVLATRFYPGR